MSAWKLPPESIAVGGNLLLWVSRAALTTAVLTTAFCGFSPAAALDPEKAVTQYTHREWQTDDGLPQNTIRAITQTPDGLLWLGTQAGLVRFDGVRFQVFDRHNTGALRSNQIYALDIDARGDLWVGSHGGGVVLRRGGKFEALEPAGALPSERIVSLAADSGGMWIGTHDRGLAYWSAGRVQVFDTRHGLAAGVIYALASDGEGGCWAGVLGGGVHHVRDGVVTSYREGGGLASDFVWDLHLANGVLWVATNRGLSRFSQGVWSTFTTADGLSRDWIESVFEDRDGNLWIGTAGGGLNRRSGDTISRLPSHPSSGELIWTLFEDREGSLWFGTLDGGLNQLADGVFTAWSVDEGLASRQAHAVLEGEDGAIWVATNSGGLNRFSGGSFTSLTTADGFSDDSAWALAWDREGALWVGGDGGADRFLDGRVTHFSTVDGLGHNRVLAIQESRDGDVWLTTDGGLGRYREGKITNFTTADGLPHDQVITVHEGQTSGLLWIGTLGGLSRFDGERFINTTSQDGLSNERIWSLYEDASGALWIGTFGGGLNLLEGEDLSFFTTADGMYSDDITAIVEDDSSHLWFASTRGIFRVAKKSFEEYRARRVPRIPTVSFDRQDGLKSAQCFGGAPIGIKAGDGSLWFVTSNGVVTVDPRSVRETSAPGVILDRVVVDGVSIRHQNRPALPPGSRSFELHYTAATLRSPSKIRFRFRLLGFDDAWVEAGSRREAYFTSLPPGRYTFEVMASNENGDFSGDALAYSFSVRPAFTQTTVFWLLCAGAVIGLSFGIQHLRLRHLRRRELELEQVAEEAIANVKTLRGLLPICARCKKIRDDQGYWEQLETFIDRHSEASFSHGLCPVCAEDALAQIGLDVS